MKHKELAKKAGFHITSSNLGDIGWVWCSDGYPIDEQLERFAELVRQDEREACAKIALKYEPIERQPYITYAADEIRSRGKK